MSYETLKIQADASMLHTFNHYPIALERGQGCTVWDTNAKEYLDFYSGHAVCLLGHCPPTVVDAIKQQAEQLLFYSKTVITEPAVTLCTLLKNTLLPDPYKVYLNNSGSEANEAAIKMAWKYTGKKKLISFHNSFHGRSMTALSVTGFASHHIFPDSIDQHVSFATLGDITSVEELLDDDTAAVICEPIQSVGGVQMADAAFYKKLAALCKKYDVLLIMDEIQTGLGRTGKQCWLSQQLGIMPDIITTAKGLASGLPIGATIIHERIASTIPVGQHATTFSGGPVVCAAAVATMQAMLSEGLLTNAHDQAVYLHEQLIQIPQVKEVRGAGFLIGIELQQEHPSLITDCLKQGLIIGSGGNPSTYRLLPPLIVTKEQIDTCIQMLSFLLSQ